MSCVTKIQNALHNQTDIQSAIADKDAGRLVIESNRPYSEQELHEIVHALDPKYTIATRQKDLGFSDEVPKDSWLQKYKPILLIFSFILGVSLLAQYPFASFDGMQWMRHFMAGFFLCFSFFKFLDLSGFANSYKSYDIIAAQWPTWGYVYAFIELALGIAYLLSWQMLFANIVAFIVMSISIIGVLRSVLNKQKIQCACLGTVFDLPMSTVTIIEDGLMIIMSAAMIVYYL